MRNMPKVTGSILWARHLLNRVIAPMKNFPQNLINQKESKRFVKMYNKIGAKLTEYQVNYHFEWTSYVENAKYGLQATLIIKHPDDNKLYVNFDPEIFELIREAKCLDRNGIEISESASLVLLQEDKFKR